MRAVLALELFADYHDVFIIAGQIQLVSYLYKHVLPSSYHLSCYFTRYPSPCDCFPLVLNLSQLVQPYNTSQNTSLIGNLAYYDFNHFFMASQVCKPPTKGERSNTAKKTR